MDGAVTPESASTDMFEEKKPETPRLVAGQSDAVGQNGAGPSLAAPGSASWLREHALTLVGSLMFIGGLLWLLKAGALPVVPAADAWHATRPGAIAAYLAVFLVVHLLRSARWGLLIDKEQRPPLGLVLSIGLVAYASLVLLPFRLGEAARPALLYSRARVPLGTSASVVGAERIIDGLVLSTLLLVALLGVTQVSPLPDHIGALPVPAAIIPGLAWAGVIVFGSLSIGMVAFFFWHAPLARLIESVFGRVSPRLAKRVADAASSIARGLRFLRDVPRAALFGVVTAVYWGLSALGTWLLLWGCGVVDPTLGQAIVILGVLGLGLVVPNAPGFFGTFQISAYSAMVLFYPLSEVTRAGSAFVFLLYVVQIASILLMGAGAFVFALPRRLGRA